MERDLNCNLLNNEELLIINGGGDSIWDSNPYARDAGRVVGYALGVTVVSILSAAKMIIE